VTDGSQRLKRLRVSWHWRDTRADPGQADKAAHFGRRIRIALDTAQ